MGYKVRVAYDRGLKRDYGTGREGIGAPYKSKKAADKRAAELSRNFTKQKGFTVRVIRSNS